MKAKRKETRRLIPHLAHLAPTHCTSEVCVSSEGRAETGASDSCGMSQGVLTKHSKCLLNFSETFANVVIWNCTCGQETPRCWGAEQPYPALSVGAESLALIELSRCGRGSCGVGAGTAMSQCGDTGDRPPAWGHQDHSPSGTASARCSGASGLPEAISKVIEFRIFLAFHLCTCVSKISQDLQWMLDNF